MKKLLDHTPATIAFLALLMGLSTQPKWNPAAAGMDILTPFGWGTVTLGTLALFAALALTRHRQKEAEQQTRLRQRLRQIADVQVRLALRELVVPFFPWFSKENSDLVPGDVESPAALGAAREKNIRDPSPWSDLHQSPSRRFLYYELFKQFGDRGVSRLDLALQIYAPYLDPEVLEILANIRTSEYLVLRLQKIDRFVEMNQDISVLRLPCPT